VRVPALTLAVIAVLSSASHAEAPIDEVVVTAARDRVLALAKEVRKAEHRYYDLYNQLNTVRDYVVKCRDEASTGSRFTWDGCQPVFEEKSRSAEGSTFTRMFQGENSGGGSGAAPDPPGAPASVAISARRPDFQKHMVELTRENPELARLLNEYSEAIKKYDSALRGSRGAPAPAEKATKTP
jgi:hypothetical protein